jgi:hypothetical protein
MKHKLSEIWQKISDVIDESFGNIMDMLYPTIEIIADHDRSLIVKSEKGTTEFNKIRRIVQSGSNKLTPFKAIKSIDITYKASTSDRPERWIVSLNLNWYSSIRVGTTCSQVDASIIGAHISTATGIKVRAL